MNGIQLPRVEIWEANRLAIQGAFFRWFREEYVLRFIARRILYEYYYSKMLECKTNRIYNWALFWFQSKNNYKLKK